MASTKSSGVVMATSKLPSDAPGWSAHFDVELTRRKVFHAVIDPEGLLVYRSRLASDIFDWMVDNGITCYTIVALWGSYGVSMSLNRSEKEPASWQK